MRLPLENSLLTVVPIPRIKRTITRTLSKGERMLTIPSCRAMANKAPPANPSLKVAISIASHIEVSLSLYKELLMTNNHLIYECQRFLLQSFSRTMNLTSESLQSLFSSLASFWARFLVRKRRLVTLIGLVPFLLAINHLGLGFCWQLMWARNRKIAYWLETENSESVYGLVLEASRRKVTRRRN